MGEVKLAEAKPIKRYKRSAAQGKAMAFKAKVNALRKMIRSREMLAETLMRGACKLKRSDKLIKRAKKSLINSI